MKVRVRTDPDNLDAIYVFDEDAKRYIEAKCTLPGYADGITAEQHRWMLSKAKKDYEKLPLHLALLAAKSALRDYTARLIQECYPTKKRPKRGKAARGEREALMQREEARQGQLPLEPEAELDGPLDLRDTNWDDETDIPLFPVRRGAV